MIRKLSVIIIILSCFCVIFMCSNRISDVKADSLKDTIENQLGNLDLSEIEDYFNNIESKPDVSYYSYILKMLNGEYELNFNSIFDYFLCVFFNQVIETLPLFLSIIAISIFCGLLQNFKSSFLSENTSEIIFFICFIVVIMLLSSEIITIYNNAKNTIENISKLTQIMSPIILTLMIASGGTISASIYKPTVAFLSGGAISIFLNVVIPLVGIMILFSVVSNFSTSIKLNKFIDCASSIIKWVIGLTVTIFGIFISVNGIASATHDGISIRAAKYAITNTIPIVGGFIKDGFDLIVAGSVLIKNTIGISVVFVLFFTLLSPIIYIAVFSLLLKFTAAITENVSDVRISNFCTSMSKCITYLCASIVMVGFMFLITIILMILSANAFF